MEDTAPSGYSELAAYLGPRKSERPWGNNTRVRQDYDAIVITLHSTEVAHVHPDGSITLNTGGWLTPTTKDRLNKVLALAGGDWRVWSEKGVWMLHYRIWATDNSSHVFADGVTVWPDGRIEGQGTEPPTKLKKAAKAYVNKLVAALFDGSLPAPGNGDCWYCLMRTENGKSLGDASNYHDHIREHIAEDYLVPSLLNNVLNDMDAKIGIAPRQYAWALLNRCLEQRYANLDDITSRQLKRAVWVYIATRIGLPV